MLQKDLMSLTLYLSSNCKSPIIYDFEFFLPVRRHQGPKSEVKVKFGGRYFRRVRCQRLPGSRKCLRGQHRAADQPDLQKLEKPHWHIDMDQPDFGAKRAAKLC